MWIVMTSSASMPASCQGHYRNVALVLLTQDYTARGLTPARIARGTRGIVRIQHLGAHFAGKTSRCAYQRTLAGAERAAYERNNVPCNADVDLLTAWGGSA